MPTAVAIRPAVGLTPPGFDPRPCVSRPAEWWDTGNEHNARAIRYCRNVCPLRAACKPVGKPKDQIIAGRAYNHAGKQLTICGQCDHPRARPSNGGAIRCGCLTKSKWAPDETEQQADYLYQISRCEHLPEWRQPGGLCGGCGKDDFAEMGEAA